MVLDKAFFDERFLKKNCSSFLVPILGYIFFLSSPETSENPTPLEKKINGSAIKFNENAVFGQCF